MRTYSFHLDGKSDKFGHKIKDVRSKMDKARSYLSSLFGNCRSMSGKCLIFEAQSDLPEDHAYIAARTIQNIFNQREVLIVTSC